MKVQINSEVMERLMAEKNADLDIVANSIGITTSYLCMLKNPEKYLYSPSPKLRERILKYFECAFDDMFVIVNN